MKRECLKGRLISFATNPNRDCFLLAVRPSFIQSGDHLPAAAFFIPATMERGPPKQSGPHASLSDATLKLSGDTPAFPVACCSELRPALHLPARLATFSLLGTTCTAIIILAVCCHEECDTRQISRSKSQQFYNNQLFNGKISRISQRYEFMFVNLQIPTL